MTIIKKYVFLIKTKLDNWISTNKTGHTLLFVDVITSAFGTKMAVFVFLIRVTESTGIAIWEWESKHYFTSSIFQWLSFPREIRQSTTKEKKSIKSIIKKNYSKSVDIKSVKQLQVYNLQFISRKVNSW